MVVVDGQGVPLGSTLASASPAEVKLAEQTLDAVCVPRKGKGRPKKRPVRLIADKGYDSDPFRKQLKKLKIELIAPHRSNRKKPKTQDGRKLRRYKRRWKVERMCDSALLHALRHTASSTCRCFLDMFFLLSGRCLLLHIWVKYRKFYDLSCIIFGRDVLYLSVIIKVPDEVLLERCLHRWQCSAAVLPSECKAWLGFLHPIW
ncbi:MAG: IS4/IS5 family transposase [Desulfobacteraceae bacterium]|nr:MAG: IS4/IS5 family transposase [Desulfobacteraceae bacterium]